MLNLNLLNQRNMEVGVFFFFFLIIYEKTKTLFMKLRYNNIMDKSLF